MTKNPKFVENKFFIEINNISSNNFSPNLFIFPKIYFSAFVVLNNSKNQILNTNNNKNSDLNSQAKLLGENSIDISDFYDKINSQNPYEYIKHTLNLIRKSDREIDVVGKINLLFKITFQSIIKKESLINMLDVVKNDDIHELPEMDNKIPFSWRIRVFLRSCINLPFKDANLNNIDNLPSPFIEIGWTQYFQEDLNYTECLRSFYIESNRFPIWNKEIVYYPPSDLSFTSNSYDGFFNIIIRDLDSINPIKKITFPIESLRSYHPVNGDFYFNVQGQNEKSHLYLSLVLEEVIFRFL